MAVQAQYTTLPKLGTGVLTAGDFSRTAPTQVATVFTAGASGSRIDRIVVEAAGATTATQVRLWSFDGVNYRLWQELALAAATPSSSVQTASATLSIAGNPTIMPLILPIGSSLRATINDTQLTQAGQADSLVASGTLNGVVTLGNSRFTVTAAATAAVSALATQGGAALLTLTATPYLPAAPSTITLTSTGNISAVNFTIRGTDATGAVVTEVIAGPNNNTVYTNNVFASVMSVYCSAAVGTATSVGISSSVTMPVTPTPITITSAANISGVTFTIRGTNNAGVSITENLVGGVAGATVTSANTYRSVNLITASGSAATTSIGTPPVITAVNVIANGGDF